MKRVLMVGAGSCQLNGIIRLKALGYQVVVADYHEESPGKKLCDIPVLADTFDHDAILEAARAYQVQGLLTVGTDQPVLSVTLAQHALGLPYFLSPQTALWVTNKRHMKAIFVNNGIPTMPYILLGKSFEDQELVNIAPPYVVKPVDSQGQRGIFKCDDVMTLRQNLLKTFGYTREEKVLVETFYPNDEVTLSGWVDDGKVVVLTITDRVTFHPDERLGVCIAHDAPSKHMLKYGEALVDCSKKICKAFGITEGPIYFQFLIGNEGIKVNEIACRLGGAYEDIGILKLTGIDVLALNIQGALCEQYDKSCLGAIEKPCEDRFLSTELFFCRTGKVAKLTDLDQVKGLPFVVDAGYNIFEGQHLGAIENASQRAGYAIVTGTSEQEIEENIDMLYTALEVLDSDNNNLVIKRHRRR